MAKYDEREGNSCHIHMSLRAVDGAAVSAEDNQPFGISPMFRSFLAGQLTTLRELRTAVRAEHQLLQAVRRSQLRAHRGGVEERDNWTCALRVVSHATTCRAECRSARW